MSAPMKVDPVELVRMWDNSRVVDIAAHFGVSKAAVSKWARILGLPLKQAGRGANNGLATK